MSPVARRWLPVASIIAALGIVVALLFASARQANRNADRAQDATIAALDRANARLAAHGLPTVGPIPAAVNGAPGGSGGSGGTGGLGGNGGTGGPGGTGGKGGRGGAVVVVLTPAPGPQGQPGPEGSPGAQGHDGADGSPGPAPSTVYCDPPNPIDPNAPVACTTASPTPAPAPAP